MKQLFVIILFLACCMQLCITSCTGQTSSDTKPSNENAKAIGEEVKELGKDLLIVFQDSKNNYWFGSHSIGVYNYDGKKIIHYSMKDGLCNDSIFGIQEDKLGNVYFDTQTGVSQFDGKKFVTLTVSEEEKNVGWKLDPEDLWFQGNFNENGVYRFDGKFLYKLKLPESPQEKIFNKQFPASRFCPYGIYSIYKDSHGFIWFGTANLGVCRFDGFDFKWIYEDQLQFVGEGSFGIRAMTEDDEGYYWINNLKNKFYINDQRTCGTEKNNRMTYLSTSGVKNMNDYYLGITKTDNGELWMTTYDNGVWQKVGEKLIHYEIKEGTKNVNLFSIYIDNKRDLWLGTHEFGVYKWNGEKFERFQP